MYFDDLFLEMKIEKAQIQILMFRFENSLDLREREEATDTKDKEVISDVKQFSVILHKIIDQRSALQKYFI